MNDTSRSDSSPGGTSLDETVPDDVSPRDVITVVLIEDNRLVREGITEVLNRLADIRVVASYPHGRETLVGEISPDVVLLDVGLEDEDSLEVVRKITENFPEAGIILMDLLPATADIVEYISLGVSGFVMKDAPLDEVAGTIRTVASGVDVLPDAMTATLFSRIAEFAVSTGGTEHLESLRLTPREGEVIELVADGMSNKAVASELHISIHTVKSHLRNIMEKLNLHSRLQLARWVDHKKEDDDEPRAEGAGSLP